VGSGRVPKFVGDPSNQPQACPDGRGFSNGPVGLVDRDLKMAETFRASIAVDRRMPWQIDASVEALYSRIRSDVMFVNAQLAGPQGVDAHGRVLYGSVNARGGGEPALIGNGQFPEVIDLRNHSLGHSWALTAQLDRSFSNQLSFRAAYTHSRGRDLQSLTNGSAVAPFDIWASGRPLSGRHDDMSTGISSFEVAHHVVLSATYAAPWNRWKTNLALYYVGESGAPFTYGDSTVDLLGDLNADGTAVNDPVYVPRSTSDPAEISFDGSDPSGQAAALEKFISRTPCLNRQRGSIVARNSCRGPWVNTSNAAIRQSLQTFRGKDLSLQLEVFNLLNLFRQSWGLFRVPNPTLLQHFGQRADKPSQPVFHFDAASAGSSTQNLESGYQLQLSVRYSF
jgi:hypothetical protein